MTAPLNVCMLIKILLTHACFRILKLMKLFRTKNLIFDILTIYLQFIVFVGTEKNMKNITIIVKHITLPLL